MKGPWESRAGRDSAPSTICTFLETWLDMYPEDSCQSSDLYILNKLVAYLLLNVPCPDLAFSAHMLLTQLKDKEASELNQRVRKSPVNVIS